MSRIRTRGSISVTDSYDAFAQWQDCSQSNLTAIGHSPIYGTGTKTIFIDESVPNFHKRVRNGEVFFNNMYKEVIVGTRQSGDGIFRSAPGPTCSGVPRTQRIEDHGNAMELFYQKALSSISTITPGALPPTYDLHGRNLDYLIIELSTKVRNDRGRNDSNIWETLAESDKALGTLTGVFKNALGVFRKRNLKGFTKEATSGYLAWRYGISPLISDVGSVLNGLTKKVGRMRKTTRATGSLHQYGDRALQFTGGTCGMSIREQTEDQITVRAMSLDEFYASKAYNLGLTSKGLITLPWELVHYSFVLDWFANVGDFLGAITPTIGWTQLGSCITVQRVQRTSISCLSSYPVGVWTIDKPATGGYELLRLTSQRFAGLRDPEAVVRTDFRFQNLTRCLDAFSLLSQRALTKG